MYYEVIIPVSIYINDAINPSIFVDTYKEAVEAAKPWIECGHNVVITKIKNDEDLKYIQEEQENKAVCNACMKYLNEYFEDWEEDVSQDALCSRPQMEAYCRKKLSAGQYRTLEAIISMVKKKQAESNRIKKRNKFEIEFTNLELEGREVSAQELAEKIEVSSKELLSWLADGVRQKKDLKSDFEKYTGKDGKTYIRRKREGAHD